MPLDTFDLIPAPPISVDQRSHLLVSITERRIVLLEELQPAQINHIRKTGHPMPPRNQDGLQSHQPTLPKQQKVQTNESPT